MDITRSVKTRRSVRSFEQRKVPRSIICRIMDQSRWAPSAHNAQPWRLVIVDDQQVKHRLATDMGRAWLSDMRRDGIPRDEAEKVVKLESCRRITESPVVVIACLSMDEMHKYHDPRRKRAEYVMAVQSVAAYIQTMLLIAHSHGLAACWICAPLFCPTAVKRVLKLPKQFQPQAMIIIGYTDNAPSPPRRKPLDEICAFNSWSKHQKMKESFFC